jgi:hypothetical protein
MLGQNHGCAPKKDPHGLPLLSSGHPCWTAYATESIGLNDWRAVCSETGTYSSVGGRWNRAKKAPRQRPTRHGPVRISSTADCWQRGTAPVRCNADAL